MSDDENRKRVHQDDIDAAISSKRAALGSSSGGTTTPSLYSETESFLFKLLCPQSITGLIIGRKGAIINQLNQSTGAKIRLSQNNEFYPGTTDRILLINGSKDCIANALNELVKRIAEAPEHAQKLKNNMSNGNINNGNVDMYGNPAAGANRGPQGTFQIRVLIPRIASAAIIGRKGSVIQRMGDVSNCKFQLGEDNDPYNTKERILIINSIVVDNLILGAQTLMNELLADPRIRTYTNSTTNYSSSNFVSHSGQSPPMNSGNVYRQSTPPSYPQMNPTNGPPPLLPLMNPYGAPPPGSYMHPMAPNGQFINMPPYNPAGMHQQMPIPIPMGAHHTMQHPAAMPQPHMYPMMPPHQQQQFPIPGNGAMMPPQAVFSNYGSSPMQQDAPHHIQQYPIQQNLVMPNGMYMNPGHLNVKK